MLQNVYSLPDLIDLALKVPEVGAVNFNILHIVLHNIVKELKLTDVRPWCHIENPFLSKLDDTKAKLQGLEPRRVVTEAEASRTPGAVYEKSGSTTTINESEKSKIKDKKNPSESSETISSSEDVHPTSKKRDSVVQTEHITSKDTEIFPSLGRKGSVLQDTPPEDKKKDLEDFYQSPPDNSVDLETIDQHLEKETTLKPSKGKKAQEKLEHISLKNRLKATEEGLHRLSNIVDIIADKFRKAEKRKKEGGPESEELEAVDERLLELEEIIGPITEDHDLLMKLSGDLDNIMKDIEEMKALAALIKQMQSDIATKADKEETIAALATKASVSMVDSKVDRLEFETAIEELGEAIGLLGLKFLRKNDEWEEHADEIWKAIQTKMTRDIFEAAKIKIESRITALMYALRKLKKVVENLLYPEASGVTRCILCRRPACIGGLECVGIIDSPKRALSEKSSEDEEPDKLKKTLGDTIAKRRKLDEPPYCESPDIILRIPYSSSSYRTSIDQERSPEPSQMKLMPITRDSEFVQKISKVPKLPDINDISSRSTDRKKHPVIRSKTKPGFQKTKLKFTNELYNTLEKKRPPFDDKYRFIAVLEGEPSETESSKASSKSSSVVLIPDPTETMSEFIPARLMSDPQRRDILSPTSSKEGKFNVTLSPLKFDTK